MDSFEWNKIFGAVLGTVLFVLAIRAGAETLFHKEPLEQQAYVIEGVQHEGPEAPAAPAEEALPDFASVIPAANVEAGAAAAATCGVCHTWTKGGETLIGPNLHGVIGRAKASLPGFAFSPALQAKGGEWTYADLFRFLKSPGVFAPGTKMAFAGVPRTQDRVNLIAFLRNQADSPAPLPPPQPAAPPTDAVAPGADAAAPAAEPSAAAPAPAPAQH